MSEDERKLARIAEVYTSIPDTLATGASASDRHIFIVGLPRSGTTLVERILGALPGVRSNGETDNLSAALLQCAADTPGDIFARCALAKPEEVARRYEALAAGEGRPHRIIEKLPLNYLYVGAIVSALPNSHIVCVRRRPIDSCFAMFRTLFGEGYPFSYDFDDLARYYAAYDRLMRHWHTVFPGRMIDVDYERLVASPSSVGQELAKRCGLVWTDAALDLSQNRTPSLTASASQVRDSIYSTSSGIWANYKYHLEPLISCLRQYGVTEP